MRFPVVPRSTVEALQQAFDIAFRERADQMEANYREQLNAATARANTLTNAICAMKLAGASPVRAGLNDPPPPEKTPEELMIADAIREQVMAYGGDTRMIAHFRAYARDLRQQGLSAAQIVVELGKSVSSEQLTTPLPPDYTS